MLFRSNLYYLNLYKCGAMLTIPDKICDVPAFSTKTREAAIDPSHVPSVFIFPKCSFGDGGIRNGWSIGVRD